MKYLNNLGNEKSRFREAKLLAQGHKAEYPKSKDEKNVDLLDREAFAF